jgi:hypothetical protein
MLWLYGSEDLDVIFNTVIFISKWEIWKIRNKVKYNQSQKIDAASFHRCLLFGRDGIFRLTNSFFSIYVYLS